MEAAGRIRRSAKLRIGYLALVVTIAIGGLFMWRIASSGERRYDHLIAEVRDGSPVAVDAATESRIVAFCSDCHALPRFESYPQDAWHDLVLRGYEFYARSGRVDLDPPTPELAIAYYRSNSSPEQGFPDTPAAPATPLAAQFLRQLLPGSSRAPAIAHLRWTPLQAGESARLLACDMRGGDLVAIDLESPAESRRVLSRLNHPCHVERCDLDGDQVLDLVVADLGSTTPDDHDRGRVIWLRGTLSGEFQEIELATGLGRVADVRPADFDRDGDLDLVVAVFGLHSTGQILVLWNQTEAGGAVRFAAQQVDARPGTIHVPIVDLNDDGALDFVALISQEYETLVAFINQPDGRFRPQRLWSGPDLAIGSSGVELVDLDCDGDQDLLFTNGDAFDNAFANRSHGVHWLENNGDLQFTHHRLLDLTGAFRAVAGDLDLDDDLDIVVVAQLPEQIRPAHLSRESLPAVVILEQTAAGVFVPHTLDSGTPRNAALELADFDGDGDLDFAVGAVGAHWITVWQNQQIAE